MTLILWQEQLRIGLAKYHLGKLFADARVSGSRKQPVVAKRGPLDA